MHSTGVVIASLLVATASVFGVSPPRIWVLTGLAGSVAFVGVPHGGLDHLTGRKLLATRLPNTWAFIFFPAYLAVALIVVSGWFLMPFVTAVLFFATSAWHFGLEDDRLRFRHWLADHTAALAVGGLVIWIPMMLHSESVSSILEAIIPSNLGFSVSEIVNTTQLISYFLSPVATFVVAKDAWMGNWTRVLRNASLAMLFASADVLISFGIYFCGWHSIRGLTRLAKNYQKSGRQLAVATAPLSCGAIALGGLGMWFWSAGQGLSDSVDRTLFVALSAIAVPHLLLHGPITELVAKLGVREVESVDPVESIA
ncbi:MAG: Brp/Blh family beta-carotene 15,15'-dioxygenase [Planctomycetota bacterium]|nr:Brp/Blh family beta-carotene 15,15'-dioxygenase [Planctomycetota bacterium]